MPGTGNAIACAGADADRLRLDRFLAAPERLGSRGRAAEAIARGKVFVNGVEAAADAAGARLTPGDVVRVWMDRPGTAKRRPAIGPSRDLRIIYEDDALLVLNKPAGLLVVPLERRSDARRPCRNQRSTCASAEKNGRSSSTASIATRPDSSCSPSAPTRRRG